MRLTEYVVKKEKISASCLFAVISDLHGCDPNKAIEILKSVSPDFILAPGDIFERLDGSCDSINENGFILLSEASKIAPVFYSGGNHEIGGTHSWALGFGKKVPKKAEINEKNKEKLKACGAYILDNSYERYGGFVFGGLSSGILNDGRKPDIRWLDEFCSAGCPKILLCHHPEYYEKYLRELDIDIIVSGHAHGGQWSFFGRGVFAPGQGVFPKYCAGIFDERLVISRGMKTGGCIPRIFNPTEVVTVRIN